MGHDHSLPPGRIRAARAPAGTSTTRPGWSRCPPWRTPPCARRRAAGVAELGAAGAAASWRPPGGGPVRLALEVGGLLAGPAGSIQCRPRGRHRGVSRRECQTARYWIGDADGDGRPAAVQMVPTWTAVRSGSASRTWAAHEVGCSDGRPAAVQMVPTWTAVRSGSASRTWAAHDVG
jgi:hypothetical protein